MTKTYSYYRVFYRYVADGKVKRENVELDALNMEEAKMRVIRGEKKAGRLVAVDKVKRLKMPTPKRSTGTRITPKRPRLRR